MDGEEVKIDNREIVEAKWWKVEEALELGEEELYRKTRETLEMVID